MGIACEVDEFAVGEYDAIACLISGCVNPLFSRNAILAASGDDATAGSARKWTAAKTTSARGGDDAIASGSKGTGQGFRNEGPANAVFKIDLYYRLRNSVRLSRNTPSQKVKSI